MNYARLKELIGDDQLEKLAEEFQPVFDEIDEHQEMMRVGKYENGEECKRALLSLTGVYMALKPACELLDAEKLNRELRAYNQIRIKAEKDAEKKFVSAAAEKEAGEQVRHYRWIRNLFQGYADACQAAMGGCQSILKYIGEEMKLNR